LARSQAAYLVVSFSSDWLYTRDQAMQLVNPLLEANKQVEYHHVEASFGHDSFLVEVDTMNTIVGGFLRRQAASLIPSLSVEDLHSNGKH